VIITNQWAIEGGKNNSVEDNRPEGLLLEDDEDTEVQNIFCSYFKF
jgi:hypothetical protein